MISLPLIKLATQLTAGMGASKILGDIIRNNVAVTTPAQALCVKVGGFVLGSMLVEQTSNHIEAQVSNAAQLYEKIKNNQSDES